MAKKNEIIVKNISIKTMTINGVDYKGGRIQPLSKPLEFDAFRLV